MGGSAGSEQTHAQGGWLFPVALVAAALLFAVLGTWQVQRLFWKQDLIARLDARLAAAPVPAPGRARWRDFTPADEYTRVVATGTFAHDKEALVTASTEQGPGFWVLTPLQSADGSTIIVNRGFVDAAHRTPEARAVVSPTSPVSITGLLRVSEADVWILRRNDPSANRWHRRDPAEIARARGLVDVAPFFLDAEADRAGPAWPVAGMTRVAFHNNHLVYALTWFALALLSAGAAIHVVRTNP